MMNEFVNELRVIPATIRNCNGFVINFVINKINEKEYKTEIPEMLKNEGYNCYYIISSIELGSDVVADEVECAYDFYACFFTKDKMKFNNKNKVKLNANNTLYYYSKYGNIECTSRDFETLLKCRKITFKEYIDKYEEEIFNTEIIDWLEQHVPFPKSYETLLNMTYCIPAKICNCIGVVIKYDWKDDRLLVRFLRDRGFNVYYLRQVPSKNYDPYKNKIPETIWNHQVNNNSFGWFVTTGKIHFSKSICCKNLFEINATYYSINIDTFTGELTYAKAYDSSKTQMTVDEFICYSKFYNNFKEDESLYQIKCKAAILHRRNGIIIKADEDLKNRSLQYILIRKLKRKGCLWYTLRHDGCNKDIPYSVMSVPLDGENIFGWFISFDQNVLDFDTDNIYNCEVKLTGRNSKVYTRTENNEIQTLPFTEYLNCNDFTVSESISLLKLM